MKTKHCGLTVSGDCLGGCDPEEKCRPIKRSQRVQDDPADHPIDCDCIYCIPGA